MKKIAVLCSMLLLAGCLSIGSSAPSKFYSLSNVPADKTTVVSQKKVKIGIEEVKIPTYLDKPQIVTRDENTVELRFSEENRWSEPLSSMMQRALANDLAFYFPNSLVKARYLGREKFDYLVFVEVEKFEGNLTDQAVLSGWWYVIDKNGDIIITKKANFTQETGAGYEDMVVAESNLVNDLAAQIAQNLAKLI